MVVFLAAVAADGDRSLPSGGARPEEIAGEVQGGLRWTIRMRRVYSALEPMPVQWTLENATDETATAIFDDTIRPRVRLTRRGGETKEAAEKDYHGRAARYATIHPEAKSLVHRLDVPDFRFMFGRLEPGSYGLQLVWPAGGVRLEGEAPAVRASPVFEFEVRAASLEKAEGSNARDPRAEFVVREGGAASLVNRSDGDLVVAASKVMDRVRTWDSPRTTWRSWVPGVGWARLEGSPDYFCGSSKSSITVKPGASIDFEPWSPGDGIHRFEVECWPADAPRDRFVARSRAFRVDRFDAAWERALKEKK